MNYEPETTDALQEMAARFAPIKPFNLFNELRPVPAKPIHPNAFIVMLTDQTCPDDFDVAHYKTFDEFYETNYHYGELPRWFAEAWEIKGGDMNLITRNDADWRWREMGRVEV